MQENIYPNKIAEAIPADAAERPPVIAPKRPFFAPSIAPLAKRYPNPEIGTVAPALAKSTIYFVNKHIYTNSVGVIPTALGDCNFLPVMIYLNGFENFCGRLVRNPTDGPWDRACP